MRKNLKLITAAVLILSLFTFGVIRLWFSKTDGFRLSHITSTLDPDPRWEIRDLTVQEQVELESALSQSYRYLDKGCQSYVFESEDGKYILKFLKYQRFRPQFYFYWFTFLPEFKKYLDLKVAVKEQKLERLFNSFVIAFDHLPEETGLIYVHLNKTDHLNRSITIKDYAGHEHLLDMDKMEFLIQKKGEMLSSTIDRMMAEGKMEEVKEILSGLFQMIVSEYHRGISDNDPALMQNTGVIEGRPFQLDVGRFVLDPVVSNPALYHQEIYNKYYKFRHWLKEFYPELSAHVDQDLFDEMGERFYTTYYIPSK